MRELKSLFDNNARWAGGMLRRDPDFFERLARQQAPEFLWIGCSDSRVPANEIVGLMPGEVFVHRNLANIVSRQDTNCLSVIQYAVHVLSVRHIMVVGHYSCGGVKSALGGREELGLVAEWLGPLREVAREHAVFLRSLPDEHARWDRLCELNVIEQVRSVIDSMVVREAWGKGHDLTVHGWIYAVQDGRLRDLDVTVGRGDSWREIYEGAVRRVVGRERQEVERVQV